MMEKHYILNRTEYEVMAVQYVVFLETAHTLFSSHYGNYFSGI